jgi:hypothetical protein
MWLICPRPVVSVKEEGYIPEWLFGRSPLWLESSSGVIVLVKWFLVKASGNAHPYT